MNKIREEEGVFILFLVTIAVSKENKGEGRLIFHLLHLPKLRKERLKKRKPRHSAVAISMERYAL